MTDMRQEAKKQSRLWVGMVPAAVVIVVFMFEASSWFDRVLIVVPAAYAALTVLQLRLLIGWLLLDEEIHYRPVPFLSTAQEEEQ